MNFTGSLACLRPLKFCGQLPFGFLLLFLRRAGSSARDGACLLWRPTRSLASAHLSLTHGRDRCNSSSRSPSRPQSLVRRLSPRHSSRPRSCRARTLSKPTIPATLLQTWRSSSAHAFALGYSAVGRATARAHRRQVCSHGRLHHLGRHSRLRLRRVPPNSRLSHRRQRPREPSDFRRHAHPARLQVPCSRRRLASSNRR